MSDLIESSTNTVMGVIIFVVMVCAALIPITLDQIRTLATKYADTEAWDYNVTQYTDLLSLVLIFVILGVIIGIVRMYSRSERD